MVTIEKRLRSGNLRLLATVKGVSTILAIIVDDYLRFTPDPTPKDRACACPVAPMFEKCNDNIQCEPSCCQKKQTGDERAVKAESFANGSGYGKFEKRSLMTRVAVGSPGPNEVVEDIWEEQVNVNITSTSVLIKYPPSRLMLPDLRHQIVGRTGFE
ncbi:hypothetical protein PM082_012526 [Marasmius tenuissimus]|nr:hypothetical protein PM082_012526 [Marasmius tenuissimus]